jgi:hypothetical protein
MKTSGDTGDDQAYSNEEPDDRTSSFFSYPHAEYAVLDGCSQAKHDQCEDVMKMVLTQWNS